MIYSKAIAFKVNKQAPSNASLPTAYGTVIDCRSVYGGRGVRSEDEVKSRQVRLTRVPGPDGVERKKRKRGAEDYPGGEDGEDTLTGARKKPEVAMSSSQTAPAQVSAGRPTTARKPQLPTPTKLRKGRVLKKQVELDIWFEIMKFTDPAQLLEMRSKIPLCYHFLRNHSKLWKDSRDYFYNQTLPDPSSELTEFQYAHLRHGHGCMSCPRQSTRKTYWAFLRRWCKPCLHSKTIKEMDVIELLKDVDREHVVELLKCIPAGIFDSWDNYIGVGPANTHPQKSVYIRRDVEDLVAEYVKERDANPATWHAECRVWMDEKERIVQERRDFARKMELWEDRTRQSKSSDFQEKKMARKKYFQEKAAALVPPVTEKELENCESYKRAVAIPKMPNMLSWSQLKPKVEKEVEVYRAKRALQDQPPTHDPAPLRSLPSVPQCGSTPPIGPPQPTPSSQGGMLASTTSRGEPFFHPRTSSPTAPAGPYYY